MPAKTLSSRPPSSRYTGFSIRVFTVGLNKETLGQACDAVGAAADAIGVLLVAMFGGETPHPAWTRKTRRKKAAELNGSAGSQSQDRCPWTSTDVREIGCLTNCLTTARDLGGHQGTSRDGFRAQRGSAEHGFYA